MSKLRVDYFLSKKGLFIVGDVVENKYGVTCRLSDIPKSSAISVKVANQPTGEYEFYITSFAYRSTIINNIPETNFPIIMSQVPTFYRIAGGSKWKPDIAALTGIQEKHDTIRRGHSNHTFSTGYLEPNTYLTASKGDIKATKIDDSISIHSIRLQEGFYWVKLSTGDREVVQLSEGKWLVAGVSERSHTLKVTEINPKRIVEEL